MTKPYKEKNPYSFARAALRNASIKWPARSECLRRARVSRGKYRCNICKGENFGPKEVQVDHIFPVVEVDSEYADMNKYIVRLYCSVDGLQVLCIRDHEIKSATENAMRTFYKQQLKEQKKKSKLRK